MESTLNEEKVTVQSLITSVPAASSGVQTGHQSSSSSDCKEPISEVGNLASVVENASRSVNKEYIVPKVEKSDSMLDHISPNSSDINDHNDSIVSISKTPNTNEPKSSNTAEKSRLCGAARRRLKMYMEKGMSYEEAHKICLKPMREVYSVFHSTAVGTPEAKSAIATGVKHKDIVDGIRPSEEDVSRAKKSKEQLEDQNTNVCEKKNIVEREKEVSLTQPEVSPRLKQPMALEESKIVRMLDHISPKSSHINDHNDSIVSISKNPNTNEPKSSNTAEKSRLCGAARRRLKMYMEKGMSYEEAHKICLKPMREVYSVFHSTAVGTPEAKSAIATGVKHKDIVDGIRPSEEDVSRAKKSKEQLEDQNTNVCEKKNIVEREKEVSLTQPEVSPRLKQPLALEESKIAQQKVVLGFFPNSIDDVTDRILSFIQWQNEGLYVFAWKLLRRSNKNGNVMLTLLIDKLSAAKLEEIKGEIFYKFRQIRLHVKDYDEKKRSVKESTNVYPIESITTIKNRRLPGNSQFYKAT